MRLRHTLLTGAALAILAAGASAQTTPTPSGSTLPVEGVFRIGGAGHTTSDNLNKVGEYVPLVDAARVGTEFWGERNGIRFDVGAYHGGTPRDQDYRADVDFRRLVKAHVSYRKFVHRLDHDPLTTYMDASSPLGGTFVTTSTNTDPTAQYAMGVGEFASRLELTTPTRIPVTFFLGHNRLMRDGARQVMTIAHCSSCHVYSFTRQIDESTREILAGATMAARALSVEYTYENSKFDDRAPDILHQYNNAIHPATLVDMFLNRVQYDDGAGLVPIATVPGISKGLHQVRARLQLPGEASLVGQFTRSTQRNEDQNLEVDYTGVSGRLFVPISSRFSFKADLRRYDIRADDVFVDVVELTAPAGLHAGLTYAQAYPTFGNPDFIRYSELSRTPTELRMEFGARPARRTFLRAGYEWTRIERDHFDVEKTTTNTFYVAGRSQLGKKANARFRFQIDDITDPFTYKHAAIPQVLQPFPSPGSPPSPLTGLQYFQMYRSRQGDLSAFPTSARRFDGAVTLTPTDRVALTVHYNFGDAQNDELNYSTWGRTVHAPGIDLYISPGDKWTLSAGYAFQKQKLETLFSTLAFAG